MSRLWLICTFLICLVARHAGAQELAPVPALIRSVTDLTETLDADQVARLEARLRTFEERKGSQIAVLMVASTKPEAIEQYAIRVAEQWKIGRQKVDDGAILVVAKDDRAVRIEVGYGLEGALNDAVSKRIIEDIIVPRFRRSDFDGGVAAGVDGMMKVIDGEALPAPGAARSRGGEADVRQLLPVVLVAAVVIGGILRAALGRFAGAAVTGAIIGVAAWFLAGAALIALMAAGLGFLFTLLSGGRMGLAGMYLGHGHGRGRSGWGGGGGGFGGGGASGRW